MNKAFEINRNLDHMKSNKDYDTWQIFQNRKEKFNDLFWELEPIGELPPHRFEGKLNRLEWLDYPRDMLLYPIVSKRMIQILLAIRQFQNEIIPLEIHDRQSTAKTNNFVFLHLLECIDALDKEKTEYRKTLGTVKNAALKEPHDGYPPLFRVKDAGLSWFVSAEAKEALEEAEIKGVHFVPLIAS